MGDTNQVMATGRPTIKAFIINQVIDLRRARRHAEIFNEDINFITKDVISEISGEQHPIKESDTQKKVEALEVELDDLHKSIAAKPIVNIVEMLESEILDTNNTIKDFSERNMDNINQIKNLLF